MRDAEERIVYYSYIYKGEWDAIYKALVSKTPIPTDEEVEECIKKLNCKYITIIDPHYPEELRQIYRPPFVLFYKGDISLLYDVNRNLSVVGSRDYSDYGAEMTRKIVKEVATSFNIVSGLARGIDAIAHETAIRNGGITIAILGSGIDTCYPAENILLYDEISKNHLLLSEYPPGSSINPDNFPIRNRLIAGISKGVLVSEAHPKSGSGITARLALEFNRYVLFVPYRATDDSLCNAFIRDGGFLVQDGKDVIDIMSTSFCRKNLK